MMLIVTVASADDKQCRASGDVEPYWQAYQQDEAFVCFDTLILVNPADPRPHMLKGKYCLSQGDKQALGRFHLEEAKKWAKRAGFDVVADEHKKIARKYLGDAEVEKELPEVIVLKPRKCPYEFQLNKGEQTSSWIAWDEKTTTHLHFFEVNNDKYEVRYKNGDRVKVWAGEHMPQRPEDQFKITAIEDTMVLIMVD